MRPKVLVQTVGRQKPQRVMMDVRVAEHLVAQGRFEYVQDTEAPVIADRIRKDIPRAPVIKGEETEDPEPEQTPVTPTPPAEPEPGDAADPESEEGSGDEPKDEEQEEGEEDADALTEQELDDLSVEVVQMVLESGVEEDDGEDLPPGKRARRRAEPRQVSARRRRAAR